jgi:hypothetical protein
VPAGATQTYAWQFKEMPTGPKVALDVGAGYSAFSSAATAAQSTFGSLTLRLGNILGVSTHQLYGVITDFLVGRGLFTLAEMSAVP